MKSSYTRFELIKFYLTMYKLYRLRRKNIKYAKLAEKCSKQCSDLEIAVAVGFFSAKAFAVSIQKTVDGRIGKERLQKLAGIKATN